MLLASFTVHILYINIFYSVGWKANTVEFYSLFNQSFQHDFYYYSFYDSYGYRN